MATVFVLYLLLTRTKMEENDTDVGTEIDKDELRNIYQVAFLLRQKLVPDVIPPILHHAGLFEKHVHTTGSRPQPLIITQNTAPSTCLLTSAIRSSARARNPVRRVVFAIQSCDQGWTSQRDNASWTWFTAGVIPKRHHVPEFASLDISDNHGRDSRNSSRGDRFLDREREIFRNETASSVSRTHIVEWTTETENKDEKKWLSALENGDKIAVRAWAQYPGWQNKVRAVSVAIYTTAVI